MTQTEMLNKLLEQSGWKKTSETDENGSEICKSKEQNEEVIGILTHPEKM